MSGPVRKHLHLPTSVGSNFLLLLVLACGCAREGQEESVDSFAKQRVSWDSLVNDIETGKSKELRYSEEPVTKTQFRELSSLSEKIAILECDQNLIDNELLGEVLGKMVNLRQLVLVGEVDNSVLEVIVRNCRALTVLNLPNASIDDSGAALFKEISQLELLRLNTPNVTDDGLKELQSCDELRFLHLIEVPVTDASLKTIAQLEQLESFYLDGSQCTEDGLSDFVRNRPGLHFHWNQLHLDNDPHKHPH